jgi:predicted transglutaminase-like cysteine proteinase
MRQQNFKGVTLRDPSAKSSLKAVLAALTLFGLTLTAPAGPAQAQTMAALPSMSQPIGDIGMAKPIQGWVKFCESYPGECAVNMAEPAVIDITPQIWKTIVSVNQRVNSNIKPITDQEHWGVVDNWGFPNDGKGDCEDFQLLKRRMLVDGGLPRRAMRMTVVIDELGEGHAVLSSARARTPKHGCRLAASRLRPSARRRPPPTNNDRCGSVDPLQSL